MSFVWALLPLSFLLKSSSCAKDFLFSISGISAGGYWPMQYQLPGASHTRLAGSATQSLDSCEMFRTWKTRMRPYLVVWTSLHNFGLSLTLGFTLWFTALYSNDFAIIGVG